MRDTIRKYRGQCVSVDQLLQFFLTWVTHGIIPSLLRLLIDGETSFAAGNPKKLRTKLQYSSNSILQSTIKMDYSRSNNPWAKDRDWKKQTGSSEYLISTRIDLLDIDFIGTSFASEDMYWAKEMPKDQIVAMLALSTTLGLYKVQPGVPSPKTGDSPSSPRTPSPTIGEVSKERLEMIGFARFTTDHVTVALLSDVYILCEHRALGLGRWLVACCNEIMEDMPAKRRGFLMTSPVVGKRFYSRELGFWDVVEEKNFAICMTKRYRKLGAQEQ